MQHAARNNMSTENIWQEFSDQLYGFIVKRVNDRETARDILQDIFLKIHSKKDSLTRADKLTSWVFQLTRNAIIDHYRKAKKAMEKSGLEDLYEDDQPNNHHLADLACCIQPFTDRLTKRDKELVYRIDLKGTKQKDLANEMRLPYTTLKSQLQRARKKLKEMFLNCCDLRLNHQGSLTDVNFNLKKCGNC